MAADDPLIRQAELLAGLLRDNEACWCRLKGALDEEEKMHDECAEQIAALEAACRAAFATDPARGEGEHGTN